MKKNIIIILLFVSAIFIGATVGISFAKFTCQDVSNDSYIHIGKIETVKIKPIRVFNYLLHSTDKKDYNEWIKDSSTHLINSALKKETMSKDYFEINDDDTVRNNNLILNLNSPLMTGGVREPLKYNKLKINVFLNERPFYTYDLKSKEINEKICAYGVSEGNAFYLHYKAYSDSLFLDLSDIFANIKGKVRIQFTNGKEIHDIVFYIK